MKNDKWLSELSFLTQVGKLTLGKSAIERRGRGGQVLQPIQVPNPKRKTYRDTKAKTRQHRRDVKAQKRHMRLLKDGDYIHSNKMKQRKLND